jgi:hypothetical protein
MTTDTSGNGSSGILERLIRFAIAHRWMMLALTLALVALGSWSFTKLPIDATPDITNVQVQINTEAAGYSPLESEQRVTFPIETAMAGLPGLDYSRSISRYGLSQVTVAFKDGTDLYFARQQVGERLQQVKSQLPAGLEPEMGPIATGLGEIFIHGGSQTGCIEAGWHAMDGDRPENAAGLGCTPAIAKHARRDRGQHDWWLRAPDPHHATALETRRIRLHAA